MSNELEIYRSHIDKIADRNNMSSNEVEVIHRSVAKGTDLDELNYFLNVSASVGMSPFNKEIWCYKDNRNNLLVFAGRDGFLRKAQENPAFNGVRSCDIRENDTFSIDVANNVIEHKVDMKNRGSIIGAYAIVFRKGGEPTIELAEFSAYDKGYNAWKTHPAEMIKKVAESHALKKAFGISGIQCEYDYDTDSGVAIPRNTKPERAKPVLDRDSRHWAEAIQRVANGMTIEQIREHYSITDELYEELKNATV